MINNKIVKREYLVSELYRSLSSKKFGDFLDDMNAVAQEILELEIAIENEQLEAPVPEKHTLPIVYNSKELQRVVKDVVAVVEDCIEGLTSEEELVSLFYFLSARHDRKQVPHGYPIDNLEGMPTKEKERMLREEIRPHAFIADWYDYAEKALFSSSYIFPLNLKRLIMGCYFQSLKTSTNIPEEVVPPHSVCQEFVVKVYMNTDTVVHPNRDFHIQHLSESLLRRTLKEKYNQGDTIVSDVKVKAISPYPV